MSFQMSNKKADQNCLNTEISEERRLADVNTKYLFYYLMAAKYQ